MTCSFAASPRKTPEHLANDRIFFEELITRCQKAGISIRAQPEQIIGLLYPLVLAVLHADDLGQNGFGGSIDLLLELVAAFCLGEVEIQLQKPTGPAPDLKERNLHDLAIRNTGAGKTLRDMHAVEDLFSAHRRG